MNSERERLLANVPGRDGWKHWGPYLSERQWGTVREDYSPYGTAWDYFPHDHARSRAYRWGEDGIAGFSDSEQHVCLSLALWNGRDPILKERLFGLNNGEGNHGEDVKEQYFYLDATPTHSYLKMLYKYPQRAFPYSDLVAENARRGTDVPEYELLDTGVFAEDRYFDVFVEYAQVEPCDILMKITAWNRGPEAAPLHLIPQLVLRNTWSWEPGTIKPLLRAVGDAAIGIEPAELGISRLYFDGAAELLFTENETNALRLWNYGGAGYFKDGFHERIIAARESSVNPAMTGTKAGVWHRHTIPAGDKVELRLRLSRRSQPAPFEDFEQCLAERRTDADEFYAELQQGIASADERAVQRQAFAGMIWNKQFYHFDVYRWLKGDPGQPAPPEERKHGRNSEWKNLNNADIVSMPDKWEYPWYASWDLGFHCVTFALIDSEFAKHQLILLTREWYMRPNGQLPAYEWAFSDVNPPVHGWAAWRVYQIDRKQNGGRGDLEFLERVFHKLMLNFTWWVNQKDRTGRNIFQGGFLGLDNIGVFDRSARLPNGCYINQSDGTSWMAMYALNLMRIALELAQDNHVYEDIASKFFEHFLNIAGAMAGIHHSDGVGLWDEEDQFFYDVLTLSDGGRIKMRIRSMVGLIPMFAVETLEPELLDKLPGFRKRLEWLLAHRPDLAGLISYWHAPGRGQRRLLSLLRGHRMKKLLLRMLDESEFLSDHGVRSMSRAHLEHPYVLPHNGSNLTVRYTPAESDGRQFGGNSNWRGPIWFPVNFLLIESLQKFHHYYGDDFKVECPTGSGKFFTLEEVANELSRRLARLFLKDADGNRAVLRQYPQLQTDPNYRDYIPFYEFFDGDDGRGAGSSHQTGWTGLIAKLLMPRVR